LSRNLVFWALIVLLPIAVYTMLEQNREAVGEINYTTFQSHLERDNIAEVTITNQKSVEGQFKRPVTIDNRQVERFQMTLPFEATEAFIKELQDRDVRVIGREPKTGIGTVFVQFLPWLILIGLWIFFFRTLQQGGNRAFSFGKSKAKLLTGDTPKVTFQDVAGCDEAKVELQEIIEFLKDPQRFQRLGGRLPKGVLLVGPPGTGKTLLARAVAGEAGRPFFSMSGSDFVEMFVGVGASRVRDLFEQGKAHAPCIIFIDEIDAVGRHRGAGLGGGHDEREQTLNQLLVEMDGFESNEGVILIAATNRPDVLDPALLRPGRFDRQIVVDMPDVRGREMIVARATPGLAGADLANIVNEAALLAARRNKQRVHMVDLEDAKDKVTFGIERRSLVLTDEEKKLTAYHEAGHAIVGMRMPGVDPVHKVTIVPRGRSLGSTYYLPEEDKHNRTKEFYVGQLALAYGGRVAEEIIFGAEKITTGAFSDIQHATEVARRMVTQFGMSEVVGPIAVGDREHEVFLGREISQRHEVSEKTAELVDGEVKRILEQAYRRATEILKADLQILHRMANALLERETLDREEVRLILKGDDLPPRAPAPEPMTPTPPTRPEGEKGKASEKGPILGTPPAEPAGA
jgi:cell division protease FtsH